MQPSPKNLAVPVTGPISFEAEKYFNDLSPNKKFVKVCNSQIFSKKIKIFALNFVFHCRQLIFWDVAGTFGLADGQMQPK